MPVLQLRVSPQLPAERLAVLVGRLTHLSTDLLGKRREVTAVIVDEVWKGRWYIGGRPPQHATAMLEIRVTAGTNTVEEKEGFVAAAFDELQRQLGTLEEASYVVVQEVAATDWGYGGMTQAQRRHLAVAA